MVMPRSRSRSIESSTWSIISRCDSAPVASRRRSARVDLPWSMCAMIEKLRMNCGSIYCGECSKLNYPIRVCWEDDAKDEDLDEAGRGCGDSRRDSGMPGGPVALLPVRRSAPNGRWQGQ